MPELRSLFGRVPPAGEAGWNSRYLWGETIFSSGRWWSLEKWTVKLVTAANVIKVPIIKKKDNAVLRTAAVKPNSYLKLQYNNLCYGTDCVSTSKYVIFIYLFSTDLDHVDEWHEFTPYLNLPVEISTSIENINQYFMN